MPVELNPFGVSCTEAPGDTTAGETDGEPVMIGCVMERETVAEAVPLLPLADTLKE